VPIVLKSGSLNLLEPSGSVQACTEIALPMLYGTSNYTLKKKLRKLAAVWACALKNVRQPCPRRIKLKEYRFEGVSNLWPARDILPSLGPAMDVQNEFQDEYCEIALVGSFHFISKSCSHFRGFNFKCLCVYFYIAVFIRCDPRMMNRNVKGSMRYLKKKKSNRNCVYSKIMRIFFMLTIILLT